MEQGEHSIRKSLIYSTKKAFLERAVVELVYKSTRSPTMNVLKHESISKVRLNFLSTNIYTYITEKPFTSK